MKRSLAGLVLLMLACSQHSSTPPSWPATLGTSQVDFKCRLPVLDVSSPGAGIYDAFIDFPAGSLVPAGTGSFYYDWVVSRWLPVTRYSVSPDGRRYAIAKNPSSGLPSPSRVYVVDAATGADLVVVSPYRDLVFTTGLADDHGIWMSGAASLYLIRRDGSIRRVAGRGGVPVNTCS